MAPDGALKGARIGVARDFMGADPDVDWIMESAILSMKKAGATVVDVHYPKWFLDSSNGMVSVMVPYEFKVQINDYLKTLGPKYPHTLAELVDRNDEYTSMGKDGAGPNVPRWNLLKHRDLASGPMTDPGYTVLRDYYLPMTKSLVEGTIAKDKLDAIIYPTGAQRDRKSTRLNSSHT